MKQLIFLCALTPLIACATTQSKMVTKRPMVASMQPMAPAPVQEVQEVEERDDSASAHLERAFHSFRLGEYGDAANSFEAAIGTNNLNDSGRALAYWHVYLCRAQNSEEDPAADALMSFTVVAEDMLSGRNGMSHEYLASRDFIERFNLEGRLARARATLAALWVDRSEDYGRSGGQPIRVQSNQELDLFLEIAPPCEDSTRRQIDRKVLETDGETEIEEVTLYCDGQLEGERYVIERVAR